MSRDLVLHPVHLTPNREGQLPPSAFIPFCSYQGETNLLGEQKRPELNNLTVCDKFEPTILEGKLCYSLDITKILKKTTRVGESNGLWILVDSDPFALNASAQMKPEFKVFVHTLAQYTTFGSGEYAMYSLKKMSGTDSFRQLPENQKKCHNHNREQCEANMFFGQIERNCNCVPWALVADNNSELVRWQPGAHCTTHANNVFRSPHHRQHFLDILISLQN